MASLDTTRPLYLRIPVTVKMPLRFTIGLRSLAVHIYAALTARHAAFYRRYAADHDIEVPSLPRLTFANFYLYRAFD